MSHQKMMGLASIVCIHLFSGCAILDAANICTNEGDLFGCVERADPADGGAEQNQNDAQKNQYRVFVGAAVCNENTQDPLDTILLIDTIDTDGFLGTGNPNTTNSLNGFFVKTAILRSGTDTVPSSIDLILPDDVSVTFLEDTENTNTDTYTGTYTDTDQTCDATFIDTKEVLQSFRGQFDCTNIDTSLDAVMFVDAAQRAGYLAVADQDQAEHFVTVRFVNEATPEEQGKLIFTTRILDPQNDNAILKTFFFVAQQDNANTFVGQVEIDAQETCTVNLVQEI